jgi:Kef-type K+ transport system membrane component KefB
MPQAVAVQDITVFLILALVEMLPQEMAAQVLQTYQLVLLLIVVAAVAGMVVRQAHLQVQAAPVS